MSSIFSYSNGSIFGQGGQNFEIAPWNPINDPLQVQSGVGSYGQVFFLVGDFEGPLDSITNLKEGDGIIFNGTKWIKLNQTLSNRTIIKTIDYNITKTDYQITGLASSVDLNFYLPELTAQDSGIEWLIRNSFDSDVTYKINIIAPDGIEFALEGGNVFVLTLGQSAKIAFVFGQNKFYVNSD